ncbi:MAG: hypothetical protein R3Y33_05105 [Clostridia bacterium]
MKKIFRFTFLKNDYSISLFSVLVLLTCYCAGLIISMFFDIDIKDKLFSPFVINCSGEELYILLIHSFTYFLIAPIIFLFCSTSFFGFSLVPFVIFAKSFFYGISLYDALLQENFLKAFLVYGIIFTLEIIVLLVYASVTVSLSLKLKKGDGKEVYNISFNQFYVVAIIVSILAVLEAITNYLL